MSNAFFVYLRDPDGHRIELHSCDYYTGDPDQRPLRWSVNDLGPDGEAVPVTPANVDERAHHSAAAA